MKNDYSIILRFLKYEKKDRFERFSLICLILLIYYTREIINVYNNIPLQFLTHNSVQILFKKVLFPKIYKTNMNFYKKFFIPEFELFMNNLTFSMVDPRLKHEYEHLFVTFYKNYFTVWYYYNSMIEHFILAIVYFIYLNVMDNFESIDVTLIDKVFMNIYSLLQYINALYCCSNVSTKSADDINTKITTEVNYIVKNTSLIKETNNLKQHIRIILDEVLQYFKTQHKNSIVNNPLRKSNFKFQNFYGILITFLNIFTKNKNNSIRRILTTQLMSILKDSIYFLDHLNVSIEANTQYETLFNLIVKYPDSISYQPKFAILFELKNVSFKYKSQSNYVIKNTSVKIPSGKWINISAESGRGKSTFFNLLLKKLNSTDGTILFNDKKFNEYYQIKDHISIIENSNGIFDKQSILYNITYGIQNLDEDILLKVHQYLDEFDLSIVKTKLYEKVESLSEGQRQKIKLIRMILHDRPIWFIDEGISNLDVKNCKLVVAILGRIQRQKQKSLLWISHNNIDNHDIVYHIMENAKINVKKQ